MSFKLVAQASVLSDLFFWMEVFVWLPSVIGVVQTILLVPISVDIARLSGQDDLRRVAQLSLLWGIGLTVWTQAVWWGFLWVVV